MRCYGSLAGRTGRAGKQGVAYTMLGHSDIVQAAIHNKVVCRSARGRWKKTERQRNEKEEGEEEGKEEEEEEEEK